LAGNARSIALFILDAVHRIVGISLCVPAVGFLVLFGLQFQHSEKVDTTWFVAHLHEYGDFVLGKMASWVSQSWPSPSFSYFPVLAAGVPWGANLAFRWALFLAGL